jgi:dolichol-phosphate mannosyltransferase
MPDPMPDVSVVVPVLDESGSVRQLADSIRGELSAAGISFEIIFVDDGSTDGTGPILDDLARGHSDTRVVHLRRNFGKAAALNEGFSRAGGGYVVTIDADLQDDPAEIPALLRELDAGADLVAGWKRERKDPWHKTVPSKLFNRVTSLVSGLELHDHNTGLKAYRREVLADLPLLGEMHRFITVLAHWQGYSVVEVPVNHRERAFGVSKYGSSRLVKGAFDLLTVLLTTRYSLRPLHLFGIAGLSFFAVGVAILTYLTVLWLMGLGPIGTRPLLFLGLLVTMIGVQLVSTGLLAELIVRQPSTGRPHVAAADRPTGLAVDQPAEVPDRQSADALVHPSVPRAGP